MLDKLCWEGQTVAVLQNGHSQRVLFQTHSSLFEQKCERSSPCSLSHYFSFV